MPPPAPTFRVRPALLRDVPTLTAIIAQWAERRLLLPRSSNELYEAIRDFQVADAEFGGVIGCAALHIDTDRIAELKALAVAEAMQGRGVGRSLVEACMREAAQLGLERVFCLTYQIDFFTRLGFVRVDRSRLPEKVWSECIRCHRFLDCDEVAMWRAVDANATGPDADAASRSLPSPVASSAGSGSPALVTPAS